jgi:hypothetical protein
MPSKRAQYDRVRSVRVSDEEWAAWRAAAERQGYRTLGEWIRQKLNDAARTGR